jgi:hypothetical protein
MHIKYVINSYTTNNGKNIIIRLNISGGVITAIPNKEAKYIYFLHMVIGPGFFSTLFNSNDKLEILEIKAYRFGKMTSIIIRGIRVNNTLIKFK